MPARFPRPMLASLTAFAVAAGMMAATTASGGATPARHTAVSTPGYAAAKAPALPSDRPTRIRISSFNVLGHSHTTGDGDKPAYADGRRRMRWAAQAIDANRLDIIGFQELQRPQWQVFRNVSGDTYRMFPANTMTWQAMQNSIAWNYHKWRPVEQKTIKMPYFKGSQWRMPYILFRNVSTGRRAWVINNHHPANTFGDAKALRAEATAREIRLVNSLHARNPNVPVFSVGDKNATTAYVCPMMRRTDMRPANGGGRRDGRCVLPPKPRLVDWILGSSEVEFTDYRALNSPLIRRTTDHRLLRADAVLPSQRILASGVRSVVAIDVSGLNSLKLRTLGAGTIPHLRRLIRQGASTFNARTAYESGVIPPNTFGMLTSRPVNRGRGGTGVATPDDNGGTVHRAAGRYVASMFDRASDAGAGTGLWTSHRSTGQRAMTSWNSTYGARDRIGLNNGRDKIARGRVAASDYAATKALTADIREHPKPLQYLQLTAANRAALEHGAWSPEYVAALRRIDRRIGSVLRAIAASPRMSGRTVVLLTSDHGGMKASKLDASQRAAYTVPFIAWGKGVPRGADLYALNRHYANPVQRRPWYTADRDPIRNSYLANLTTKLLALPPVGNMDSGQTFTVFAR